MYLYISSVKLISLYMWGIFFYFTYLQVILYKIIKNC